MARRHETAEDAERRDRSEPRLVLASLGSPEDGFADAGRLFPLEGVQSVVFGRAPDHVDSVQVAGVGHGLRVDVPLPYVSGRHAELVIGSSGGGHCLSDHGSRNGTLLEGKPLTMTTAVTDGEIFEIGRSFWSLVELSALDDSEAIARIEPDGAVNPQMRTLLTALGRVAESSLPLLLTGETGVGKDRLAHAIHRASGVAGEFVVANVMATTVEQLLFGAAGESGLIERARGGTLVLDDIGELDTDAQTKLQSALMGLAPTSDAKAEPRAVRIIGASTRDLRNMVSLEGFRPDLMARLAGFEGHVPALRDRREDLGILLRDLTRHDDGSYLRVQSAVFRTMLASGFPFNVRELEHALRAAGSMAGDSPDGVTSEIWEAVGGHAQPGARDPARIQAVREALVQHLVTHAGDKSRVAESMHCGVEDVERWLDRLNLSADEYGRAG